MNFFKTINSQVHLHKNVGWIVAFGLMLVGYLFLASCLMSTYDFNDETEKLITARLIVDGGLRLYKDIFVQHGPVTYIPSHILYAIFDKHSLAFYRIIPIVLSLFTLLSVMASPLFSEFRSRLIAGMTFLFGLTAFQVHFDFVMTMYQVYAGYFYVIALSLFVLPFSVGLRVERWQSMLAGFCLSMVFFCAFSFSLVILCAFLFCFFGFLSKNKIDNRLYLMGCLIAGGVAGTLLVALWMAVYGDFVGYFIDHIYINLKFYGYHLGFTFATALLWPFLRTINPFFMMQLKDYYPAPLIIYHMLPIMGIILFVLSIFRLRFFGKSKLLYLLYCFFAICTLVYINPRASGGFGESTFIIVSLFLVAAMATFIIEKRHLMNNIMTKGVFVLLGLFIVSGILTSLTAKTFLYETSAYKYYQNKSLLGPSDTEEMRFLRKYIQKEDRVLQLPFSLNFYVYADRLPASGIFFWMPWMNDYAKTPVEGYPLDLCDQMNKNPPKAIYYTDTDIWRVPADTFMGCFKKLLKERYFLSMKVQNVFFRDDLVAANEELLVTSVIPDDHENTSLPQTAQQLIHDMRVHYAKLYDSTTHQCVIASKEDHGELMVGSCDDPKALVLGFSQKTNKILSFSGAGCLDFPSPDWDNPVRLWPCFDTPWQRFDMETSGASHIRNEASGQCLAIVGTHLATASCAHANKWIFEEAVHRR